MEEKIVLESPVRIGEITLITVARKSLRRWSPRRGISFLGFKRPMAVVVVSPSGKRALNLSGEETAIEPLIEEIPGLAEVINRASR